VAGSGAAPAHGGADGGSPELGGPGAPNTKGKGQNREGMTPNSPRQSVLSGGSGDRTGGDGAAPPARVVGGGLPRRSPGSQFQPHGSASWSSSYAPIVVRGYELRVH
jgi:hypothetical protein